MIQCHLFCSMPFLNDGELDNRIAKAWSKFQTNKTTLCDKKIDIGDRMRLFESVVTPTVLYGSACWTTNAARKRGLRTTQRKMARMMLGKLWIAPDQQNPPPKSINDENNSVSESSSSSSLSSNSSSSNDRDASDDFSSSASNSPSSTSNSSSSSSSSSDSDSETDDSDDDSELSSFVKWIKESTHKAIDIMNKFKVTDWVEGHLRRKLEFAGHVARRDDERWTLRVAKWQAVAPRRQGGKILKWQDELLKFTKSLTDPGWETEFRNNNQWKRHWMIYAQQRGTWKLLKEQIANQDGSKTRSVSSQVTFSFWVRVF